jgi:mevalonate kinase
VTPDSVQFSIAGKTFIAGEYLALLGGPALILATEPRFELNVRKNSKSIPLNPFHAQSPAGKLWVSHKDILSHFQFSFSDPYKRGGFGASSAQFALMHTVLQFHEEMFADFRPQLDWKWMLQDYRESGAADGFPPSGADIVGACAGKLTLFDRAHLHLESFDWPFPNIEFFVAHTGHKLATHEHLKSVSQFDSRPFETAMHSLKQALLDIDLDQFIEALKTYRENLNKNGWLADSTAVMLRNLDSAPGLLFAKGCGAMGSDVIFALCEKSVAFPVRQHLEAQGLKIFADSSCLASGIQIDLQESTETPSAQPTKPPMKRRLREIFL